MLSRSQIERLGERLVRSSPPAADDLAALHELLLVYGDALEEAVTQVQTGLHLTPTSRVKSTGTIIEKLHRYGGSWLKSIQDLAGMRIVGRFDRTGQDELVARLVELFDGERPPRVVDRRQEPSYGYRAVHVIVVVRSVPVEIQVRTQLQHEWADMFEKLADRIGRGIRYGAPPDNWLEVGDLSTEARKLYDLRYEVRAITVRLAMAVSGMIEAYERGVTVTPYDDELPLYRARVDAALADLGRQLDRL